MNENDAKGVVPEWAATQEEWRAIPSEPNYEASSAGRVRSVDRVIICRDGLSRAVRGQIRAGVLHGSGHLQVHLAGGHFRYVHALVLEAFAGPRPTPRHEACHGNGDPTDNRVVNLRWGTRSDNRRDAIRHGTDWQVRKADCPRGHPLAAPNLVASGVRRGRRACLACDRAQGYVRRRWAQHGEVHDVAAVADRYFAALACESGRPG